MDIVHDRIDKKLCLAPPVDTSLIEAVVRKILKEQNEGAQLKRAGKHHSPTEQVPEDDFSFDEAADALGADGLAAIANTMAMFRRD